MGLTKAGGVGGTGGVTGVTGVVVVDEPPPHPAKKAMGNTREARSFAIFIIFGRILKSKTSA
jgi:hypothetical protein